MFVRRSVHPSVHPSICHTRVEIMFTCGFRPKLRCVRVWNRKVQLSELLIVVLPCSKQWGALGGRKNRFFSDQTSNPLVVFSTQKHDLRAKKELIWLRLAYRMDQKTTENGKIKYFWYLCFRYNNENKVYDCKLSQKDVIKYSDDSQSF